MLNFVERIGDGDDRSRATCQTCGFIDYRNPKVIVGSVVALGDRVLLCRRAIEPRHGFWTLPAGYLELGETVDEGAAREAREEAGADIVTEGVLAIFSISRIDQVQVIFRARFADDAQSPLIAAGTESLDVGLFEWSAIPWDRIAFPTVRWSLDAWRACPTGPLGAPASNPPQDRRGVAVPGGAQL